MEDNKEGILFASGMVVLFLILLILTAIFMYGNYYRKYRIQKDCDMYGYSYLTETMIVKCEEKDGSNR